MKKTENKPIVRIHSECLTGDIFGSLKCDCQQQLHSALSLIAENGHGYIVYLKGQEGRGIGIGNKIAAYALQEQGLNTYEANEKLGLPKDSRNYIDAIWIFKALSINDFYIISNNPEKINALTFEDSSKLLALENAVFSNDLDFNFYRNISLKCLCCI